MIYTLTLNTAIDMNISCGPIRPAMVNRTFDAEYCPNGKGVNVGLVLDHFNQPVHIFGIFGGFTGRYIFDALKEKAINVTPAWVDAPTRINIFINDGTQEYKLVNPGNTVDAACLRQVLANLESLQPGNQLVISGSLPPGIESPFYDDILALCQRKGCDVILDISHPVLERLLDYRPLLIKPNDEELLAIFGLDVTTPSQVIQAMAELHQRGARNVLLTLGERGLYFSDGKGIWFCSAPHIELVSSACAGDAALGAFLSVWLSGGELTEALALASATGADVAASAGLGQLSRIAEYRQHIEIVKLPDSGVNT